MKVSEAQGKTTKLEPLRMNLQSASRFLGVSERSFQRLVSSGRIRYVTDPGGRRMYPTSELRKYVESQIQDQWGKQVA